MISVIVPVYNEENAVIGVLDDIKEALSGFLTYEIIVVDDGSTDQTLTRVRSYNDVNLTIIEHAENIGYGKSLYDGIQQAAYDCIAIIDGDGSYPAASLKELYQYYPKYDMIVGARRGEEYRKGLFKRPAGTVAGFLLRVEGPLVCNLPVGTVAGFLLQVEEPLACNLLAVEGHRLAEGPSACSLPAEAAVKLPAVPADRSAAVPDKVDIPALEVVPCSSPLDASL